MKWVEKYHPKDFDEFIGNRKVVEEVRKWIRDWKEGKPQPPLLLVGPTGVGKTALAQIISNKFSDSISLNASDKRSYSILMRIVGESSKSGSLFGKHERVIVLDEVDNIHSIEDRGGASAILKIIDISKHPIVLTANDIYTRHLARIRNKCKVLKLRRPPARSIVALLGRICRKEKIKFNRSVLMEIAKKASGDVRQAINMLEAIARGEKEIKPEYLDYLATKDEFSNILELSIVVLKSESMSHVMQKVRSTDEDPNYILEFIAENIPREYEKPHEIKKAYDMISKADVYLGRAQRTQNYGYWKYAINLMTLGVAFSKDKKYKKFTRYSGPSYFKLRRSARKKIEKIDTILEKLANRLHVSKKVAFTFLPYLKIILQNSKMSEEISRFAGFEKNEVKFLKELKLLS